LAHYVGLSRGIPEFLRHGLVNLKAAGTNGGPKGNQNIPHVSAMIDHAFDGYFGNAINSSSPPRMHGTNDATVSTRKQNGDAVGYEHRNRSPPVAR
jgi:hypothetical protein